MTKIEMWYDRHRRLRASQPPLIRFLLWIGFVKFGRRTIRADDTVEVIIWPFHAPPAWAFRSWKDFRAMCRTWGYVYRFRNNPGIIKWLPGRLLPVRWGFGACGFEFGDRG